MPHDKESVFNAIIAKHPEFKEFNIRLDSFENENEYYYEIKYPCPASESYFLEASIDNEGVFIGFASYDIEEYFGDEEIDDALNLIDEILTDKYILILEFKNYEMYCLRHYSIARCLDRNVPEQYKLLLNIIRSYSSPVFRIKQRLLKSKKIIEVVSWSGKENKIIAFDKEYTRARAYDFTPEKAAFSRIMQAARTLFIMVRADNEHQKYERPLEVIKDVLVNMKHADKNIINHLNYIYKNMDSFHGREQIVSDLRKGIQKRTNFDVNKAYLHMPAMVRGIELLLQNIKDGEVRKTKILASSMHNYPDFIIGNYGCSASEFYREHLCFYTREFGEDVFDEWKYLFANSGG